MEAWRFGFGASLPPAYKFDPTDADIVAHYLLPRAAAVLPNPHAHAVVDADPCSCPPWELLRRHGHAGSDHAFFFFRPLPFITTKTGRRLAKRAVSDDDSEGEERGGGTWAVQRSTDESLVLLRRGGGGGGEIELRYTKRYLSHRSNEDGRTTGWAMDEYEIVDPPALLGAVLSRVRTTARGKKKKRQEQQQAAAAAKNKKLAPGPEQPGPSNYLDDGAVAAANYVVTGGQGEGTSGGGAQAEAVHQGGDNSAGGFLGEMAGCDSALLMPSAGEEIGYYSALVGAVEDGGYYVDNSNSYFSEGITLDNFSNNYCFNEGDGSGY